MWLLNVQTAEKEHTHTHIHIHIYTHRPNKPTFVSICAADLLYTMHGLEVLRTSGKQYENWNLNGEPNTMTFNVVTF